MKLSAASRLINLAGKFPDNGGVAERKIRRRLVEIARCNAQWKRVRWWAAFIFLWMTKSISLQKS